MNIRLIPAFAAVVGVAAAALLVDGSADAVRLTSARLPDLEQEVPSELVVVPAGAPENPEYRLGFRSAVRNVGAGPLIIDGHRGSGVDTMVADQIVARASGARARVRDVGQLRFVVSPDHRHWHLLGFQRYTLHREDGSVSLVEDRKTGFCLGDRYAVGPRHLPARAPAPVYRTQCGLEQTQLFGIREGISVGYGDDYAPNLEGQYLPLTGLEDGRYVLVHRVNAAGRIRELRRDNDVASVLFSLRRRLGVPRVLVLARCPGRARCTARGVR